MMMSDWCQFWCRLRLKLDSDRMVKLLIPIRIHSSGKEYRIHSHKYAVRAKRAGEFCPGSKLQHFKTKAAWPCCFDGAIPLSWHLFGF